MMVTQFRTKNSRLRWNVREIISYPDKVYWSSLGYKRTLADARELADRNPSKHTQVVDSEGSVRYEHLPE